MDDLTTIMTEAQNAIGGDFITMQPFTPDRVLAALGKIKKEG